MFDSRTLSSCSTSAAISLADTSLNGASKVGKSAVGLKGDGLSKELYSGLGVKRMLKTL